VKEMKKIILYSLAIIALMLPTSCDDTLDININPLAASAADPNAILPFVMVQYSNRKTTELGLRMGDVYLHYNVIFNSPRNGGASAGGIIAGNTWSMLYTQVLANLSLVERDARAAGTTSNNVAAIAVILKALAFHDATSIWGDVPFTEAINAEEFTQPKYDSQESVLRGIVALLNDGIGLIDEMPASGNFNVAQGDLIYGGNMTNWRAYANSLKIRVLMLLRNKDTSVDSQLTAALSQPYVSTNGQAAMLRYPGSPGNQNAFIQIVTQFGTGSNETTNYMGPSQLIRDLLEGDPRLQLWMVDGTLGGFQARQSVGQYPTPAYARYSDNVVRATLPDVYMLPAETTFYRAELAAKGAVPGNADALFRQGVTETMEFYGQSIPGATKTLTAAQITAFVASLPSLTGMSLSEQLRMIGEQQYLEAFLRPVEAWNHVRRTKIPSVPAAPGSSITTMLKRFQYAPAEQASNANTPTNKLGDVPIWFEN
jgi:hypothetical protein